MSKAKAKKEKHVPPRPRSAAGRAADSYRTVSLGKYVLERRTSMADPWVLIGRYDTEAEGRAAIAQANAGSGHCASTHRLILVAEVMHAEAKPLPAELAQPAA